MNKVMLALGIFLTQAVFSAQPTVRCEKKYGSMKWQGVTLQRYALRADNFPPNRKYRLVIKNYNGVQTKKYTYKANDKGHLIFQKPENVEGDILAVCPAKKGERLTFSMQSDDGETAYHTDVIPFPLEHKSKKGAVLALELKGERGEEFILHTKGLKPNESVELALMCGEEKMVLDSTVSAKGEMTTLISFPKDKTGGEAQIILKRRVEEAVFTFDWGDRAMELAGACCFQIR